MGFGTNLQSIITAEAGALAVVIVIIFGIYAWIKKETGKLIGSIIVLAFCLTFIVSPSTIITFLTSFVKKVLTITESGGA